MTALPRQKKKNYSTQVKSNFNNFMVNQLSQILSTCDSWFFSYLKDVKLYQPFS